MQKKKWPHLKKEQRSTDLEQASQQKKVNGTKPLGDLKEQESKLKCQTKTIGWSSKMKTPHPLLEKQQRHVCGKK